MEKIHPPIKQAIYFEFNNREKRAEAVVAINELRKENPDLFNGLQSIKVDEGDDGKRRSQGLELAFSASSDNRDQKIWDSLHKKGIQLSTTSGSEERPYDVET